MDDINVTATITSPKGPHLSITGQVLITILYLIGAFGNLVALIVLYQQERKTRRNRKHTLMLRCLALNDLVAQLGMLVQMNLQIHLITEHQHFGWNICVARTLWKFFGLGSGSVATVMAVERWLALTHPFFYHQHVTYNVILRSIFWLWGFVAILVAMPLMGFGLYWDNVKKNCLRYRYAEEPKDIAYAYLFFTFGVLLCACIVCCNTAVIRVLCRMGCRVNKRLVGRRISRRADVSLSTSNGDSSIKYSAAIPALKFATTPNGDSTIKNSSTIAPLVIDSTKSKNKTTRQASNVSYNASTPEEIAFAKHMALICIAFTICWMPQMILIPLAQFLGPEYRPKLNKYGKLGDFLICLYFTLNPFLYVLQRCLRRPGRFSPFRFCMRSSYSRANCDSDELNDKNKLGKKCASRDDYDEESGTLTRSPTLETPFNLASTPPTPPPQPPLF